MTIYFAGSSTADVVVNSAVTVTTSSTYIDTAMVNEGFMVNNTGLAYVDFTPLTEVWASFRMMPQNIGDSVNSTLHGQGSHVFRLGVPGKTIAAISRYGDGTNSQNWNSANNVEFRTYVGGVANTIAANFAINGKTHICIRHRIDAVNGLMQFWVDGVLRYSFAGNTVFGSEATSSQLTFRASSDRHDAAYSEVLVADYNIRDARVASLPVTANGAVSGWTGSYADIDETGFTDTDFISAATADLTSTFVVGDTPSGYDRFAVSALVVSARSRRGVDGPQNLDSVVRMGGSNYTTPLPQPDTAFGSSVKVLATNPQTSLPWTKAQINAAEVGVKSVT
jgi:hypothetical protein